MRPRTASIAIQRARRNRAAYIVSGAEPHILASKLFTHHGAGTMIERANRETRSYPPPCAGIRDKPA